MRKKDLMLILFSITDFKKNIIIKSDEDLKAFIVKCYDFNKNKYFWQNLQLSVY